MSITVLDGDTTVCEPSLKEVREYAEFIGIDVNKETHLEWIARDGLRAPVPPPWKACTENGEDIFYFNFDTGESVWDHPCDEKYRIMVEEYRKIHIACPFLPSPAMESKLENMWCGGIKDHKPTYEEIASQVEAKCNIRHRICLIPSLFPSFRHKLVEYTDVTQEDIDEAWLDAAVDVLGRPAQRPPIRPYRFAYERFRFRVRSDYRATVAPPSSFDIDRYNIDGASLGSFDFFQTSRVHLKWPRKKTTSSFSGRPDLRRYIERTSSDEHGRNDLEYVQSIFLALPSTSRGQSAHNDC